MAKQTPHHEQEIRDAYQFLRDLTKDLPDTLTPEYFVAWAQSVQEQWSMEFHEDFKEVPNIPGLLQGQGSPRIIIFEFWLMSCLSAMAKMAMSWDLPIRRDEIYETVVRLATVSREQEMSFDGFGKAVDLAITSSHKGTTWTETVDAVSAACQNPQTRI